MPRNTTSSTSSDGGELCRVSCRSNQADATVAAATRARRLPESECGYRFPQRELSFRTVPVVRHRRQYPASAAICRGPRALARLVHTSGNPAACRVRRRVGRQNSQDYEYSNSWTGISFWRMCCLASPAARRLSHICDAPKSFDFMNLRASLIAALAHAYDGMWAWIGHLVCPITRTRWAA